MFTGQQLNKIFKRISRHLFLMMLALVFSTPVLFAQHILDSSKVLKKVIITADKKQNTFATAVPVQLLNRETINQINAESIADAARYFSGVLINDYGGIGGLKTISVRSLGALNTGLIYDGIPVADVQTGQIELSKFSATFVQTLELDEANPQQILLPARAYSSASILAVTTNTFNATNFFQTKWEAGIKQGSFGLRQPFAGIYLPVKKNIVISANVETTKATGNYPYYINNGILSQKAYRTNSDIQSLQGEINVLKRFADSSTLQTKLWGYTSERGLPGSVIFYNNISVQRLWDQDIFLQSRYQKKIGTKTALLISGKYSSQFTRYRDPNFLNNAEGLDDRYNQQEIYLSAALSRKFGKYFLMSVASDIARTNLTANITSFANPTRTTLWNVFSIQYAKSLWQINGSLLNTNVVDKTDIAVAATNKNEFTPTIAGSFRPTIKSPLLFRFFYKNIFRLPTFNDLYYTFIQNINPKLLPEYSKQYNAGITYSKNFSSAIKQLNFSVDGYYNTVKDKIIAVPGQNLFIWTMENLGKVHIKGVDVNTTLTGNFSFITQWTLRMAYTWQQALDVTDPTSTEYKNEIPYTPNNSGSGLAMINYKSWSVGCSMLFSGTRYTLGANNPANELNGWGTQDVFVAKLIKLKHLQANIKGEVNNILNERYAVIRYYPMPGRSYKISITFNNL